MTNRLDDTALIAQALASATDELIETEPMLVSRLFDVPSEAELASGISQDYDPVAVKARRDELKTAIAKHLEGKLQAWLDKLPLKAYEDTPKAMGERALRNVVLHMMAKATPKTATVLALRQYEKAGCMTEAFGALSALVYERLSGYQTALNDFYTKFQNEDLVIDNWFMVQASADGDVGVIKELMAHKDFDWTTPNRVRSVLRALASRPVLLWSEEGLQVYLDALTKLDTMNPQLSARLLGELKHWSILAESQKSMAHAKLTAFKDSVQSRNVLELAGQLLTAE